MFRHNRPTHRSIQAPDDETDLILASRAVGLTRLNPYRMIRLMGRSIWFKRRPCFRLIDVRRIAAGKRGRA
jgi:hypothetical protein